MPQLTAVFFDLYETLVTEYEPGWTPVPTTAARLGLSQDRFTPAWKARQAQRMTGAFPDFRSVLHDICQATNHPVDEVLLDQLQAERLAHKARPFARIRSDIVSMLEALRRAKLRVGLISNCSVEEVAAWQQCVLHPLVDDAVFSYQVGCVKPSPAIYHLACARLQVDPGQAIFVGDGGSDELRGATHVGMMAYRATWYMEAWPAWKATERARDRTGYGVLRTPAALLAEVEARLRDDHNVV